MAKIIPFKKNAAYYAEKAFDKSDEDDLIGCLRYLRRAEELARPRSRPKGIYTDEELAIQLEIAETLGMLGLYQESNKLYFRLIAFDYALDDIYYGIVRNFALSDMPQEAAHYLNYAIDEGYLSEADGFEPISFDSGSAAGYPPLRLYKKGDNSHTLYLAKKLLHSPDPRFAGQMLASIPEYSEQYPEAANYLALLKISEDDFEGGDRLLNTVLDKDPRNITALTTRIFSLDLQNRKDEARMHGEELDALGVTAWPDSAKIAMCFCQIGDSEKAKKYLTFCLKELPYDREMLLLYALACNNAGDNKTAREKIILLQSLFPEDPVIRYYAKEIVQFKNKKSSFFLTHGLPPAAAESYAKAIERLFVECPEPDLFYETFANQSFFREACLWGLYYGDCLLQQRIGVQLAKCRAAFPIVRNLLLNPEFSLIPKKSIFAEILKSEKHETIQAVFGFEIRTFRPRIPSNIKMKPFPEAYWQVYAALSLMGGGFDRKLNYAYRKLYDELNAAQFGKITASALAAVLSYRSGINKVFSSVLAACEVFEADEAEVKRVLSAVLPIKKTGKLKKETED